MVMFICLNLNYNTASKLNNSFTRKCYKVGRPVGTSCILIEWATIRALWIRVCPKMEQPMAIKIWDTNHFEYLDVIRFSDFKVGELPKSSIIQIQTTKNIRASSFHNQRRMGHPPGSCWDPLQFVQLGCFLLLRQLLLLVWWLGMASRWEIFHGKSSGIQHVENASAKSTYHRAAAGI